MSKSDEKVQGGPPTPAKMAEASKAPEIDPKTGKLPPSAHKKRWGGIEYPSDSFVRVTFLQTGSINGERFIKGKSGAVPKAVLEKTLIPNRQAELYKLPAAKKAFQRPATDVGSFRRR